MIRGTERNVTVCSLDFDTWLFTQMFMVNKLREKRERERIDLEFNLLDQAFIYETDKRPS